MRRCLPDPNDGRAKLVRLTPSRCRCRGEGRPLIASIEADWERRLGTLRATALRIALEALHEVVWPPPSR